MQYQLPNKRTSSAPLARRLLIAVLFFAVVVTACIVLSPWPESWLGTEKAEVQSTSLLQHPSVHVEEQPYVTNRSESMRELRVPSIQLSSADANPSHEKDLARVASSAPSTALKRIRLSVAGRISRGQLSESFVGTEKLILGQFASMDDADLRKALSSIPSEVEACVANVRTSYATMIANRDKAFDRLISSGRGINVPTEQLAFIAPAPEGSQRRFRDDDSGMTMVIDLWENEDAALIEAKRVLEVSFDELMQGIEGHLSAWEGKK